MNALLRWLAGWVTCLAVGTGTLRSAGPDRDPVVFYDATGLFRLDLRDPVQRRRFWDESHLLAALQGLANRERPRLFLRYLPGPDDFWWQEMIRPGAWMADRPVERLQTLEELLARFRDVYRGAVVWDERVPATSNLASTIAGADDLLPLRQDDSAGSLARQLTESGPRLQAQVRLLAADGAPLFTGKGVIPGTMESSTGSAKCDAYVWLITQYVRTGRTDPRRLGYYLDAWWLQGWNRSGPENHTLSNQDFLIARRGVLFDLGVWDDEAAVDDPGQRPGTDAATLKRLLRAAWDATHGTEMVHVAGFVPWAFKYTDFKSAQGSAGGRHEPVPTEWRYAEILSCFNAYMDADALGLGAMANASFFQHFPLRDRYPQKPRPDRANLIARGILDSAGRIPSRTFVAHYVGDYDAAAWLYRELPRMWRDPARGRVPLAWAFNPNLANRFAFGMAWAREHATTNDWFVAGDSGAGYLNPGYLTEPRPHSGLPSGLATWERHCRSYFDRWDLGVTGFVIDGYAREMAAETWDAYARFSPGGVVAQKIPTQGVRGALPFLRMATDLSEDPVAAAREIRGLAAGPAPRFLVCRSILRTPTWYAQVSDQLQAAAGGAIQVVDLPALLWLVREFETHREAYVDQRFARTNLVTATPEASAGLFAIEVTDGKLELANGAWRVGGPGRSRYLYFDADDEFCRNFGRRGEVKVQVSGPAGAKLLLEYDSYDARAPVSGAYKSAGRPTEQTGETGERTLTWRLDDARFTGAQNGNADFRLVATGGPATVHRVSLWRE